MSAIGQNIADLKTRIAAAAERSGRSAEDVTLVCVTKTRSPEEIRDVIEAGERNLGENRAQEFIEKYDQVQDIAEGLGEKPNMMWHFIGHLQRNKVKYIAEKAALIHSVDSFRLAEEIDARAAEAGITTQILIQLNPAGEAQKFGVALSECEALADEISGNLPHIRLAGMMAVAPVADNPEDVREYFRSTKRAFDALASKRNRGEAIFKQLSMGMSHDFEVAIEEGATIVRVGTAIFGPRNYETEGLK